MFCGKCGAQVADGVAFCPECGAQINSDKPAPATGTDQKKIVSIAGIVGCALSMLSVFLPYMSVSVFGFEESVSLIEGDGWFFLVLGIVGIVCVVMRKYIGYYIAAGISLILLFVEMGSMSDALEEAGFAAGFIHKGAGYHFLIIGVIVMVAAAVGLFLTARKEKAAAQTES